MTKHADDTIGVDEPEDGWVTSPQLYDTIITSTTLCRFTGVPVNLEGDCPARDRHADVDCRSLYMQAEAIAAGALDQALFNDAQQVVRRHTAGDDVVGTTR